MPIEHHLQNRDIDPALVVADHHVPAIGLKVGRAVDLELRGCSVSHQPGIDRDPAFRQTHQDAGQAALHRLAGQDQLEASEEEQRRNVNQRADEYHDTVAGSAEQRLRRHVDHFLA